MSFLVLSSLPPPPFLTSATLHCRDLWDDHIKPAQLQLILLHRISKNNESVLESTVRDSPFFYVPRVFLAEKLKIFRVKMAP